MRLRNQILIFLLLILSSCKDKKVDISQALPEYRLLHRFSKKIQEDTGLVLFCYGINNNKPLKYEFINGTYNFHADYKIKKSQEDTISIESARSLLVSVVEGLLQEINSDSEVRPRLDIYPLTCDLLQICIFFQDENQIELGTGVSYVYFSRNKLKYKGYRISEYRSQPPAIGKHYTILEETYEEALEAVKREGLSQNPKTSLPI